MLDPMRIERSQLLWGERQQIKRILPRFRMVAGGGALELWVVCAAEGVVGVLTSLFIVLVDFGTALLLIGLVQWGLVYGGMWPWSEPLTAAGRVVSAINGAITGFFGIFLVLDLWGAEPGPNACLPQSSWYYLATTHALAFFFFQLYILHWYGERDPLWLGPWRHYRITIATYYTFASSGCVYAIITCDARLQFPFGVLYVMELSTPILMSRWLLWKAWGQNAFRVVIYEWFVVLSVVLFRILLPFTSFLISYFGWIKTDVSFNILAMLPLLTINTCWLVQLILQNRRRGLRRKQRISCTELVP